MIENKEDTLAFDFVYNLIVKETFVNEEILLGYEDCYRRLRRLALLHNLDTMDLDKEREQVMKMYNQL